MLLAKILIYAGIAFYSLLFLIEFAIKLSIAIKRQTDPDTIIPAKDYHFQLDLIILLLFFILKTML
jgi:hypothetical protein